MQQDQQQMPQEDIEYAGFWMRTGACIIDSILIVIVTFPLLISIYGWSYLDAEQTGLVAGPADFLISWVFPALAVITFWVYGQATPGKMAISARIVDAETGEAASIGQLVGRYLGYFLAGIPLGLGILWVAFDKRKQGWHDKLAGTVVIRQTRPEPVRFNRA